jgi:D-serine deaminase-like pyridoxal phosphate-dependent protein
MDVDSRLDRARRLIGSPRDAIPTPALILDLPCVQRNIDEMARRMSELPAALRPHAKIHKSPILGRMQVDAGAIGLTTATVWEASAMIEGGIDDVLIANQVVGPVKTAELARVAALGTVVVAVDSLANAHELSAAATSAGSVIDVIVELDVGTHRSGVRTVPGATALGRDLDGMPGLRLRGLLGYEAHAVLEPDRPLRITKTQAANALLLQAVDEFDAAGLNTEIVAAGGFGTWDITGANPRITEIHAGSYIFGDVFHSTLAPGFESALTVQATVISRWDTVAVLDCGRKSIGIDRAVPEVVGGVGAVKIEHGEHFVHEEHTVLDVPDGSPLAVGDTVRLMPGYGPTTVNLYDIYYVIVDDVVTDIWPVHARYGSATAGVN